MAAAAQADQRLIEFVAGTHTYYVDGSETRSTTQILKDAGMVDSRWFTDYHRWRGSETHKAIATWNRAGKIDRRTIDPKIRPYLEAAIGWQQTHKFVVLFVEHRMHDPLFDVCGTADLIGHFEDDPKRQTYIVDYKTNDHRMGQLTSKWQTASYGHMYDPKGICGRIEVVLGPDGKYGPVNSFPMDSYLTHVNEFYALSITARLRREGGLL
jgi:hypothetical protein